MDRRTALKLVLAASAPPLLTACGRRESTTGRGADRTAAMPEANARATEGLMPSVFIAHGSPFLVDDTPWVAELRRWALAMPRPKSVLMISAHWLHKPLTIAATKTVPLLYDFYGFPKKYYDLTYPAPGAPELARRVRELLAGGGTVVDDPTRGLDHGAFIPLLAMYPDADVPILQISIPTMEPDSLLTIGRALAPLRREGVLIVGSGALTHNLGAIDSTPTPRTPSWASEFDAWTSEVLGRRDVDALVRYRERAPGIELALPTQEHFVPVCVAMGASVDRADAVQFPITGFAYGSFTKRSVQFG
jgi:4,5-DOPA dioxygenase extradiol